MGRDIVGVHFDQPYRTRFGHAENRANIAACTGVGKTRRILGILLLVLFSTTVSIAETVRVATFNVSLGRRGNSET